MDEEKLLPCPFCGGKAKMILRDDPVIKTFDYEYRSVMCDVCGCTTAVCEDEELAIKYWNKRHGR